MTGNPLYRGIPCKGESLIRKVSSDPFADSILFYSTYSPLFY